VDAVAEQRAHFFPRGPTSREIVLHHPLAERLGDDGPQVRDPRAVAQPIAVGVSGHRRDAVDHRVRERAVRLDPRGQPGVGAPRGRQRGAPRGVAVPRQVVAAEDRERSRGALATDRQRSGETIEGRARPGCRLLCRGLGVPGLGDRQREDRRRRRGDELGDSRVVAVRRVHVADDRADHLRGLRTVSLLDQGVQVVLRAQRIGHPAVLLKQPESDDAPAAAAGCQFVHVDREVRPMKAADPHVDDARGEPPALICRDRNPAARDLAEMCLAETDRG
jgi:hypothetical protein